MVDKLVESEAVPFRSAADTQTVMHPNLSPEADRTFHGWIDKEGWSTRTDADEQRGNRFIDQLITSGDQLTPEELRDLIISTKRGTILESSLDRVAEEYMERYREKLSSASS